MKEIIDRIKKDHYLNFEEQKEVMRVLRENNIKMRDRGLLVDLKKGAFYKRRKAREVPRLLLEVVNLHLKAEKLKRIEEVK